MDGSEAYDRLDRTSKPGNYHHNKEDGMDMDGSQDYDRLDRTPKPGNYHHNNEYGMNMDGSQDYDRLDRAAKPGNYHNDVDEEVYQHIHPHGQAASVDNDQDYAPVE